MKSGQYRSQGYDVDKSLTLSSSRYFMLAVKDGSICGDPGDQAAVNVL